MSSGAVGGGALGSAASRLGKKDFESDQAVRWCPGCGDYAILAQLQKVMPELGIPKQNIVFISGIGCSSRFPYYMDTFGFHTIHGRAPALATGLKVSRPELSVWVVTGDGDGLSIGGNHLIHALRRNVDLKILLFNNQTYGLTKGQFSPTSTTGTRTKSSPLGTVDRPFSVLSLALGAGATFVARTVDTEVQHLQALIREMAEHPGSAFLEIYQNCPVLNDGVWESLKDRHVKADHLLALEDGQPLVYGKESERILRLDTERMRLVPGLRSEEDGLVEVAHDRAAPDPALALMLASLAMPEFPAPIGVLRAVREPTFDSLTRAQEARDREQSGPGSLQELLEAGSIWTVS